MVASERLKKILDYAKALQAANRAAVEVAPMLYTPIMCDPSEVVDVITETLAARTPDDPVRSYPS